MFGALRLILASLVVLSHSEIYFSIPGFYWFSQGAAALVGFFLLSGYLMKLIFVQKYQNKSENIVKFWLDRWLRIYPHYYFYLLLIMLWLLISHFSKLNWEILPIFAHVSILPLNFINLIPLQMLEGWAYWALIIPQSWTLASEFQFYLILPFLLKNKWYEISVLILSLIIFILACFGILPTEAFGYRLLAGSLFIFLSGSILYDLRFAKERKTARNVLILTWTILLILSFILRVVGKLSVPLNGPVIFGYLTLLPIIYFLSGVKKRPIWDDLLGNLSYGVFLNHYWLLWVLDWLNFYPQPNIWQKWFRFGIVILTSFILSWMSYNLVDKKISLLRRNYRK